MPIAEESNVPLRGVTQRKQGGYGSCLRLSYVPLRGVIMEVQTDENGSECVILRPLAGCDSLESRPANMRFG